MAGATEVQSKLFTAAAPGTTWAVNMDASFTALNQVLIVILTNSNAAFPSSVSVGGALGYGPPQMVLALSNTAATGTLSVHSFQMLPGMSLTDITVKWAAGPTNVQMRVHEFTPSVGGVLPGWTASGTSAGSSSAPATALTSTSVHGLRVAGLATSGTLSSESGTGGEAWLTYSLTAGAITGRYAVALDSHATASTYTWTLTGSSTYSTAQAFSNPVYIAPTTITPGPRPAVINSISHSPTPSHMRRGFGAFRRDVQAYNDFPVNNPSRVVSGHVYDSTGAPLVGVTVKLFRQWDDYECKTTVTDALGAYSFPRDTFDPFTYYVVSYATAGPSQIHGTSDRGLVPA